MVGKKVQVPVLGGLRKVIQVPTNQAAGTTIQEFGASVVTLAQLKAALGITSTKTTTAGGGLGSASLVVGPGLSGGGVLTGAVPLNLIAPIPFMFGDEGGGDGDGQMGPPGLNGVIGAVGPQGPPVIFTLDEPEEALNAVPGSVGPQGLTGAVGPTGPAIFLLGDDGEEGSLGPPGPIGPAGSGGATGVNITPDTHPTSPTAWDDEFETGSVINSGLWTLINNGGATSVTTAVGGGGLQSIVTNGSSNSGIFFYQAVPSTPWEFTWKSYYGNFSIYNNSTYKGYYWGRNAGNLQLQSETRNPTNNTYSFNSTTATAGWSSIVAVYLKVKNDGTNLTFSYSAGGLYFTVLSTQALSSWVGSVTNIAIIGDGGTNTVSPCQMDWFRRTL